jgi:hypothetical protein
MRKNALLSVFLAAIPSIAAAQGAPKPIPLPNIFPSSTPIVYQWDWGCLATLGCEATFFGHSAKNVTSVSVFLVVFPVGSHSLPTYVVFSTYGAQGSPPGPGVIFTQSPTDFHFTQTNMQLLYAGKP